MLFASPLISQQHPHPHPHRRYPQQQNNLNLDINCNPNGHINHGLPNNNNLYSVSDDFDFYAASPSSLMPADPSSTTGWLSTGQLTPSSSSRAHHRESSLSSLGSVDPASPYAGSTSNPQVAGDLYHDFAGMTGSFMAPGGAAKPLTPEHTPLQEQFLSPQYAYYPQPPQHDGLKRVGRSGNSSPAYAHGERQENGESTSSVDSWLNQYLPPVDGPAYRNPMPKIERTMTDVYRDELYSPSFQMTTAQHAPTAAVAPANDVFAQRLQAANSQHLSAGTHTPLILPSRERSPFRQGSPLAPAGAAFTARRSPNMRFGTATHMREQQKAESDALALRQQLERASPEQAAPKTISPKDVDLVYHEGEGDANLPLFPPQPSPSMYRTRQAPAPELDDVGSQQSYGSMATSRRESAYSTSSHATPQPQGQFNFAPPAVAGTARPVAQQQPFAAPPRREPSDHSNHTEDFPATMTSMESSSSEYAPEARSPRRATATADTGTYTCTYHGCTLRFETPAKLQRHKREGHRSSAAWAGQGDDGMTSAGARNTQDGPHKCERINPSTNKPCNTIFSRPYDLTRHEDTIHNARKQKVRCHLCTEDKSFSRNDALTRHFRVCHPDHVEFSKSRRRGGRDR
jgi:26S proteasome regulatory subunit N4